MPTTRRRMVRPSRRLPTVVTDAYRDDLVLRDFLGELTDEEAEVAKKLKLFRWDALQKETRARRQKHA
mgnify:FL=1